MAFIPEILNPNNRHAYPSVVRRSMQHFTNKQLEEKLQKYLVNEDNLFDRGFPARDKCNPGYATVYVPKYPPNEHDPHSIDELIENNTVSRKCSRCSTYFKMDLVTGEYFLGERCYFHPGKFFNGVWQCCRNINFNNVGCVIKQCHVWGGFAEGISESLPGFVETVPLGELPTKYCRYGVYALDCEMAFTKCGMEVIKISVVQMNGNIVYDHFVKPYNTIVDYGTEIHGITEQHLLNATKTLNDVHNDLKEFIHAESIIVGHGVFNDLRIMRFIHKRVIDSSIVFSVKDRPRFCFSLKTLARHVLNREFRAPGECHDSVQDASVAMEIILRKLQQDYEASRMHVY